MASSLAALTLRAAFGWLVPSFAVLCLVSCRQRPTNAQSEVKDLGQGEGVLSGASVAGDPIAADAGQFAQTFKRISAGSFQMGVDAEGSSVPRWVEVPEFYISETEVCFGEWRKIKDWARGAGYEFANGGIAKDDEKPVANMDWYDAVKWCNARSERAGLQPCYYLREARTKDDVFRKGTGDSGSIVLDLKAGGYRLPTEAEWEKAARGGVDGRTFPLGDTLALTDANFSSGSAEMVRSYSPNQYGLFDMAGNVWEWCWDVYEAPDEFTASPSSRPGGIELRPRRVVRGGGWDDGPGRCNVSYRNGAWPEYISEARGFRLVRN